MIMFLYAHVQVHVEWASHFLYLIVVPLYKNKMNLCLCFKNINLLKNFLGLLLEFLVFQTIQVDQLIFFD
jgi:hypothetical protein